jgi:hypothetical protein
LNQCEKLNVSKEKKKRGARYWEGKGYRSFIVARSISRPRRRIHFDVDEKLKSEEEAKKQRQRIDGKSNSYGQNRSLKTRRGLQIYLVRIRLELCSSFFLRSFYPNVIQATQRRESSVRFDPRDYLWRMDRQKQKSAYM